MEKLLEKSNINEKNLQRVVLKITSSDVNNLSQPCYMPGHKKEYFMLLNATGLTDKDIKEFAKRTYKGTIAQSFNITNEPATNLLLFIMWYALKIKNETLYHGTMVYHMARQYGHVMKRHFKQFCNPEVFEYTMETLTKTHLFYREKTIANSLFHLAKELEKKYTKDIKTFNIDGIIQFVSVSRHRISQSVKSFAEHYYRAWKSGDAMKVQGDQSDEEADQNFQQQQKQERGKKIIDTAINKITVYREIDNVALTKSIQLTKIKTSIASTILKELQNIKYTDDLRIILQLFIKEINNKSMLCGVGYEKYIRKLMSVKRTNSIVYFKQQVNILTRNIMKATNYLKTYENYTNQTQFMINSFIAFYLTMIVKNSVC